MSTFLVTGGAGFIGSHLVEALVREGDQVRVLDNLSSGRIENLAGVEDQVELISGDVQDVSACRKALDGVEACRQTRRTWLEDVGRWNLMDPT